MKKFLLAMSFLSSIAVAADVDTIIAIQQSQIGLLKTQLEQAKNQITECSNQIKALGTTVTNLSTTVTNLSTNQSNSAIKLNKYVSDSGNWSGVDVNNVVNRVITESITCAQFCSRDYGSTCFWTTFANWKDGNNALCDDNRQPLKRCLCVR